LSLKKVSGTRQKSLYKALEFSKQRIILPSLGFKQAQELRVLAIKNKDNRNNFY
tara:strand:+ start:145 stop:306 length:162 start_codon:yes stop_codon:yes gene_type:complete